MQKLFTKCQGLVTSGCHNSATITDRWKFTTKRTLYGMSSSHFYHTRKVPTQIFSNVQCSILCIKTNTAQCCQCLSTHMEEKQTELETENK